MPVVVCCGSLIPCFHKSGINKAKVCCVLAFAFLHNDDVMETLRVCTHYGTKTGEYYYDTTLPTYADLLHQTESRRHYMKYKVQAYASCSLIVDGGY